MIDSLQRLGISLQHHPSSSTIEVSGCDGQLPANQAELFVGNSGTTVRFLTALTTLGQGTYRLDGVERMRERPIGDLLDALQQLGAEVRSEHHNGCPPVVVRARGLDGGQASIRGDVSSQFLSGLLLAAPYCRQDVELRVAGPLVSEPYVTMTCQVMQAFGAQVQRSGPCLRVPAGQAYAGRTYDIEPDASAASYFWGAAAIAGGSVTVQGLTRASLQGDVRFCDALQQMGCPVEYLEDGVRVTGGPLRGVDLDMNAISDTVQTLAAVALFAHGSTRITGVAHIRHKETDRIGDLARTPQVGCRGRRTAGRFANPSGATAGGGTGNLPGPSNGHGAVTRGVASPGRNHPRCGLHSQDLSRFLSGSAPAVPGRMTRHGPAVRNSPCRDRA